MATLSTHVLDTATGRPAAGVAVRLADAAGATIADAVTDADGRVRPLGGQLAPGDYRLTFGTGAYFAASRPGGDDGAPAAGVHDATDDGPRAAFHPRITVEFTVTAADEHYHVPLLVSPFGYTTYRGS